jgi:hypothetical protein
MAMTTLRKIAWTGALVAVILCLSLLAIKMVFWLEHVPVFINVPAPRPANAPQGSGSPATNSGLATVSGNWISTRPYKESIDTYITEKDLKDIRFAVACESIIPRRVQSIEFTDPSDAEVILHSFRNFQHILVHKVGGKWYLLSPSEIRQ